MKKRREKKQRRSSQLGTQPPDGPDAVLPAREDMVSRGSECCSFDAVAVPADTQCRFAQTEDLLLLDDGASVLAEKVQTVR